jgi:ApaG protein
VDYVPSLDAPPDRPHPFVYFITIHNDSETPVTIVGRKWIVREANGTCLVVEGDGVVGQRPRIEPGGEFSYNSYHVIAADAEVEGSYLGFDDTQRPVVVRIPKFSLNIPT